MYNIADFSKDFKLLLVVTVSQIPAVFPIPSTEDDLGFVHKVFLTVLLHQSGTMQALRSDLIGVSGSIFMYCMLVMYL